jgi:hypothetical protein
VVMDGVYRHDMSEVEQLSGIQEEVDRCVQEMRQERDHCEEGCSL